MFLRIFYHCLHHVMMSLWRRKSLILATVMGTSVLIVCLQYNSAGSQSDLRGRDLAGGGRELPLGMGDAGSHKTLVPKRNLSALGQTGAAEMRPGAVSGMSTGANGPSRAAVPPLAAVGGGSLRDGGLWGRHQNVQRDDGRSAAAGPPQQRDQKWRGGYDLRGGPDWQGQAAVRPQGLGSRTAAYYVPPLRVVHFDLKGAPPKVGYFKQIFPILKEAGANAVLMEYEDVFPFWGPLGAASAGNAYSKEDVQTVLALAKMHDFEVIPLVQTFGHMEFILKLQPFRHLREVDDYPQAICPSKNDSFVLVQAVIDQVMSLHPGAKWLHVGCDEVFHLGYCTKCMVQDRDTLFLNHVSRVAKYVRTKHNVVPIVWDDMLRQIGTEKLKEFQLGSLVEPMIWTYVKDVYRFIPYSTWMTYSEIFPFVWGASAFKGAFGETLTVPNVKMHLENNEAWLEVMSEQHKKFEGVRGLVLTGWQRYDHLAALCELLPAAMPSLVLNLLTVGQGYFSLSLFGKFQQLMQCTTRSRTEPDLETDPYLWSKANGCFFPGSPVFRLTQHHHESIKRVNDYVYDVTVHKAWLTEYNVRHNITSPMRVDDGLTDYSSVYYPLTSLIRTARDALREVYDEYTVAEWIEQKIYPYVLKMEKLWKDGMNLKKSKVWPKRPLPPLEDLQRFNVGYLDAAVPPGQPNNRV